VFSYGEILNFFPELLQKPFLIPGERLVGLENGEMKPRFFEIHPAVKQS